MYNTDFPNRADLPSTRRLVRSTIVAAVAATGILVTVVLPAEYGIDPTGLGSVLGLTPMGEIKMQLAEEAAAEDAGLLATAAPLDGPANVPVEAPPAGAPASAVVAAPPVDIGGTPVAPAGIVAEWRDEIVFTLRPNEGLEYKLVMAPGDVADFEWVVEGGEINADEHGEGEGRSFAFKSVRGVEGDAGQLIAPVSGTFGWFFRNRGIRDVVVTLRVRGAYSEIRRLI